MFLTTVKIESPNCYWEDLFTKEELNTIIRYCDDFCPEVGLVGDGYVPVETSRKSKVSWIRRNEENDWIFARIEFAVTKINSKFFGFDIYRLTTLQYTLYDEEGSHFTWHWDIFCSNDLYNGYCNVQRKVSAVLQLSDPDEYEGGNLELSPGGSERAAPRKKGYMSIFPSFVMHRVTPVTKGTRRTLVAWFTGPDWR